MAKRASLGSEAVFRKKMVDRLLIKYPTRISIFLSITKELCSKHPNKESVRGEMEGGTKGKQQNRGWCTNTTS